VKRVSLEIPMRAGDGDHRPERLRQEHVSASDQPDERPDPELHARRVRLLLDGQNIYGSAGRRDDAAAAGGDGLSEAEPVSEVDLRQRGVRAADPRRAAIGRS
jgi:hypothetical protein